ncbi:MAG TPA: transcription termination/antitermination protein NusA [Dehalococcoidia bacterium]|nr:transcription termination/antitermination protein NusA [Dehalococcoidia bacterium]
MKSDFVLAVTQLAAEKNLPREVILGAVEAALESAYRKDNFAPEQEISVKIDPNSGKVQVWAEKTVVEKLQDPRCEVTLDVAQKTKKDAEIGDVVSVESTPRDAGRIAAQTAKQVILQRLHEAEHSAIYEEFADKEGDIITGVVRRIEARQVFIDLGRTEAVMQVGEQAPNERYRVGQRLKAYLVEVAQSQRGPVLVVSRSHPSLLRRLFELEVPEIYNGTVEIKSVAREAGFRSKVAVTTSQEGIDPVGCCVGLRGIRIQNIVNELNGEKIDVVSWSPDIAVFITNALSPAQVVRVITNEEEGSAVAIIPDKQLSLAIGKEGQNVRLAVKLTGWRIDIKSVSEVEEEEMAKDATEEKAAKTIESSEAVEGIEEETGVEEPTLVSVGISEEAGEVIAPMKVAKEKAGIKLKFVEDIMPPPPPKPEPKQKKKKKKATRIRKGEEDGIRLKRKRREVDIYEDEDEEY